MNTRILKGLLTFAAAVFLATGCALNNVAVPVTYKPGADSPLRKVPPSKIALVVTDQRSASEAATIGNKRNGFNSVTAKVLPKSPPAEMLAVALRQEFEAAGHTVHNSPEGAGSSVTVSLKRFFSDLHFGFWDAKQTAWIEAEVKILNPTTPNGSNPVVVEINATNEIRNPVVTTGDFIEVLEGALKNFVQQLSSNPKVLEAMGARP